MAHPGTVIPYIEAGPSSSSRGKARATGPSASEAELLSRIEEISVINQIEQVEVLGRIENVELQLQLLEGTVASLTSTISRTSGARARYDLYGPAPSGSPSGPGEDAFSDPSTSGLSTPRLSAVSTSRTVTDPEDTSHTLTEDYDLIIIARGGNGQRNVRYLVSKDVLSVSSAILRTLIRGIPAPNQIAGTARADLITTTTTTAREVRTLELEGEPEALKYIFEIIHFKADEHRRDVSFNTLCDIAVLTTRYRWQRALETWSDIWLLLWERFALNPGYENWLYISKVFNNRRPDSLVSILGRQCSAIDVQEVRPYRRHNNRNHYLNIELWPQEQRAYGSILRSVHGNIQLTSSYRLVTDWRKSAVELETELRGLNFDTLKVVERGHSCALERFGAGFMSCIAEHHSTVEDRMKRIFGDIVVYVRDRVHMTDGL
ncbi:hypothetical protein TWF718_009830 [Orbilia javanica]|uniref:Uncharacterized protein n=1 Tax=Orbilia javanica TaxID=47235 RepID=A0AAN8RG31_9PEZI